jgi:hypothetical protein
MLPAGGGELVVLLEKLSDLDQLQKEQEIVTMEISNMHRMICSCKRALNPTLNLSMFPFYLAR